MDAGFQLLKSSVGVGKLPAFKLPAVEEQLDKEFQLLKSSVGLGKPLAGEEESSRAAKVAQLIAAAKAPKLQQRPHTMKDWLGKKKARRVDEKQHPGILHAEVLGEKRRLPRAGEKQHAELLHEIADAEPVPCTPPDKILRKIIDSDEE